MKIALTILALFCIIATLVPFLKSDIWWIRMFDFPLVQLAALTFVCAILLMFFIKWEYGPDIILFGLLVLAGIYLAYRIFPYTSMKKPLVLTATTINDQQSVSILSANVYMYNRDSSKLLGVVKNESADIIILLEVDEWWQKQFEPLKNEYPYTVEKPLDNTYGMIVLSKLELRNAQIKYLVEEEIPSIHADVILRSGKTFTLYALHPTPPSPTESASSTDRDAELLIVAKMSKKIEQPIIVAGDLNDVAWSHTTRLFQRISRLLDPRIGRGMFNTFNANYFFLRWPLDHIFHSDHFTVVEMKRLPYTGSDHFPIYIKLQYEAEASVQQEAPKANGEDKEEADEKIEEAKD